MLGPGQIPVPLWSVQRQPPQAAGAHKAFKSCELGYAHMDVKCLLLQPTEN